MILSDLAGRQVRDVADIRAGPSVASTSGMQTRRDVDLTSITLTPRRGYGSYGVACAEVRVTGSDRRAARVARYLVAAELERVVPADWDVSVEHDLVIVWSADRDVDATLAKVKPVVAALSKR